MSLWPKLLLEIPLIHLLSIVRAPLPLLLADIIAILSAAATAQPHAALHKASCDLVCGKAADDFQSLSGRLPPLSITAALRIIRCIPTAVARQLAVAIAVLDSVAHAGA